MLLFINTIGKYLRNVLCYYYYYLPCKFDNVNDS